MWSLLTSVELYPFIGAFLFVVGLIVLEIAALLFGGSVMGLDSDGPDLDLDAAEFDVDAVEIDQMTPVADANALSEVEAVADVQNAGGFLGWIGLRDAPFVLWLAGVATAFAISGYGIQLLASNLIGVRLGHLGQTRGCGGVSGENFEAQRDLNRIADRRGERLRHVGDKRSRRRPSPIGRRTQSTRQRIRVVRRLHERAAAGFDVKDQPVQSCRQFLGQDRRTDQIDRGDRRGHIADRIEPLVGGGDAARGADDGAADVSCDPPE